MYLDMGERIAGKQDRFSLIIEDPLRAPKIAPKYKKNLHLTKKWFSNCFPLLSPAAPKARDGRYCNAPRPSVCPSVRPSVTFSFRTVTEKRIDVFSRNFAGTCTMSWVMGHFTARSLHSLKPSVTSQPIQNKLNLTSVTSQPIIYL